jgi:hypothetical protein
MWERLRRLLGRFERRPRETRDERRSAVTSTRLRERRSAAARARFWADAREGEREAEARARS